MPKVTLKNGELEILISWLKSKRTREAKKNWLNEEVKLLSSRIQFLEDEKAIIEKKKD